MGLIRNMKKKPSEFKTSHLILMHVSVMIISVNT